MFGMSEISENNRGGDLKIKVVGVGGAGLNAIYRLRMENLPKVGFCAVDTDAADLSRSPVQEKILIGERVTGKMSSGGDAAIGKRAALEDLDALKSALGAVDLLFLTGGLGCGTGSGAMPVIAEEASRQGTVVIAFCTLPFEIEGAKKRTEAAAALEKLKTVCDAVIPLPNDVIMRCCPENTGLLDAFLKADNAMCLAVKSICVMLLKTGLINIDFASIKALFAKKSKKTLFGVGSAEGQDYVENALADLANCPLLSLPEAPDKSDSILINISCGADTSSNKLQYILEKAAALFSADDSVRLGAMIDESFSNRVEICALGVSGTAAKPALAPSALAAHPAPASVYDATKERFEDAAKHRSRMVSKIKSRFLKEKPKPHIDQTEFAFVEIAQQRGFFEDTEPNGYNGADLDVPTYMRKNVKVRL